jgi:MOSC domain-containing protein YiiM
MGALRIRIVSVNVATPHLLGEENGEPVISAIAKKPVPGPMIEVGRINLKGDDQANRAVHGGPDKAVYSYPSDHWTWWEREKNFHCAPGAFGENLTLSGADETTVAIGDRFQWGDAVLEIAQPRVPCHKFILYTGRDDAGALMLTSGRCGWYFRVLTIGAAPVADASLNRVEESGGPTVRETFQAAFGRQVTAERRSQIFEARGLSDAWKKRLIAAGI